MPPRFRALTHILALSAVLGFPAASGAAELVIGVKETHIGPDPHFSTSPASTQINSNIFEPLVRLDQDMKLQPWLASSWKIVDDKTWTFDLRKDVKWHDGSPFTAHDVVYSYKRAINLKNASNSIKTWLFQVADMEAVDDLTLRVKTLEPSPTLPNYLAQVFLAKKTDGEVPTDDFNNGKAAIGTGPYKFVSWAMNDRTILEKNPNYWGQPVLWDKVTYRSITNDAARVAATLAGDLDIANIPSSELARFKTNASLNVVSRPSTRIIYLTLDMTQEALESGRITGPNGEKLDKNPLSDPRVRKAMKLAIDLDALIKRIYDGEAVATGQLISREFPGFHPDIKPWKPDLVAARKLMEESGWANKFKLDILFAPDFFPGSQQASESLAQIWTRIGIPSNVSSMPYAVLLRERNKFATPVGLANGTNTIGVADRIFVSIAVTKRPELGLGPNNFSRYSNPVMDKLVDEGVSAMDPARHDQAFQKAAQIVEDEGAIVPLWLLSSTTALKKNLEYRQRLDGLIFPQDVRPAK